MTRRHKPLAAAGIQKDGQVANMQNPTPDPRTLDRPTPYIGVLGKIGRCVESAIPRNPSIEKVGVSAQHTVVGTDGSVLL